MREMFKNAFLFTKFLGGGETDPAVETQLNLNCPDCGEKMSGIENNVIHFLDVPKKRCRCECGYKGFYSAKEEGNK